MRSSANSLRLAGAAFLLLATVSPAAAADTTERAPSAASTADTGAAPAAKKAKKEERKICRSDATTGSNLGKKICLTARQWRERADVEFEK